ncbi:hypothetical protein [Paraburkholderia tropica]|uniref:hypothetical protein n=1 Tax=Paraburkholderia TaxID=1822464 RepID=UPI002AB6352A|nr:hypothetical protein [Paraburkholderia tropica]
MGLCQTLAKPLKQSPPSGRRPLQSIEELHRSAPCLHSVSFFAPIARSTSASHRKTKHQNGGARIMIQIVHAGVGCNYTSLTLAVVGIRHKF